MYFFASHFSFVSHAPFSFFSFFPFFLQLFYFLLLKKTRKPTKLYSCMEKKPRGLCEPHFRVSWPLRDFGCEIVIYSLTAVRCFGCFKVVWPLGARLPRPGIFPCMAVLLEKTQTIHTKQQSKKRAPRKLYF